MPSKPKTLLEEMFTQFMATTQKQIDEIRQYIAKIDTTMSSQKVTIRNLEVQIGQLANTNSSRQ